MEIWDWLGQQLTMKVELKSALTEFGEQYATHHALVHTIAVIGMRLMQELFVVNLVTKSLVSDDKV